MCLLSPLLPSFIFSLLLFLFVFSSYLHRTIWIHSNRGFLDQSPIDFVIYHCVDVSPRTCLCSWPTNVRSFFYSLFFICLLFSRFPHPLPFLYPSFRFLLLLFLFPPPYLRPKCHCHCLSTRTKCCTMV